MLILPLSVFSKQVADTPPQLFPLEQCLGLMHATHSPRLLLLGCHFYLYEGASEIFNIQGQCLNCVSLKCRNVSVKQSECHFTRVLVPARGLHKPNLCSVSLMLQQCGEGRRARALKKESGFQRKGTGSVNSPLPFSCLDVPHGLDTPLQFSTHLK